MDDFDPVAAYEAGFVGASYSPEADERFQDTILRGGGNPNGREVAQEWGFSGLGEGKLLLNFKVVESIWGKDALPGPAQRRGDCVSFACRSALLYAMSMDIHNRKPDEVTGKIEGRPAISSEGVRQGVLSTEALYHFRSHSGDGWWCAEAAEMACTKSGAVLRKKYADIGVDLTKYNSSLAGKYYIRRQPPDKWQSMYREHQARTATKLKGPKQVRDFLAAANCGVFQCSSLGWSKQRDENGYARQTGTWHHAMLIAGFDSRDEIVRKYGEPLYLIGNSWGSNWQKGGRRVLGTDIDIPPGYYWAKSSLLNKCSLIAISSVNGWPVGKLPNFGATGNL